MNQNIQSNKSCILKDPDLGALRASQNSTIVPLSLSGGAFF